MGQSGDLPATFDIRRYRHAVAVAIAGTLVAVLATATASAQGRSVCVGGMPNAPSVYVDSSTDEVVIFTIDGQQLGASRNLLLCPGDEVRTGTNGRAAIRFDEKRTVIRLDANSRIQVLSGGTGSSDVSLLSGILYFVSSVRQQFRVETPYIVAGIEGTEALVAVQPAKALAMTAVRTGTVGATDIVGGGGTLTVSPGEAAFRSAEVPFQSAPIGELPPPFRELLIVSDASVDWAVYYPPILFAHDLEDGAVRDAVALLSSGDYERAESALDRASGSEPATTAALRTIIAIGRNRLDEAEYWSALALTAGPTSAPAHIAESYVHQAKGELSAALTSARAAVAIAPNDAYATARLAELQMIVGDRRAALRTAEASLAIARTPLALFVAGLARLSAAQYERAEAYFEEAIALDPQAPLPRLGLGLAYIRQGKTAAGAWEIERAVAHDPRRASLRTWLGRAYFDEGLAHKPGEEFALAKSEDPQDPTPYLFSALELYADNRPIQALRELQQAEAREAARKVLRSELGLGEDTATLGAAVGRIYDILGFEQQAIVEAAKAVDADPSNPGAHRFLAESYRTKPGYDIAQTSELLRSQLLSPPSKTPVQPELAETGLSLLDTPGAARVAFAEFSPLFDADGVRLDASGVVGTQETLGGESALTMLYRGFSLSVGGFHYETDGFGDNNDVDHNVADAVTTISVSPFLDVFGEYRWRDTVSGDRRVKFDLNDLSDSAQIDFEREIYRVGFHAMPAPGHDILGLASYGTLDTATDEEVLGITSITDTGEDIKEGQLQYIGQFDTLSLQIGSSVSDVNGDETRGFRFGPIEFVETTPVQATQANIYGYAIFESPGALEWTLGASIDQIDQDNDFSRTRLNPKLGLRWSLTDEITLRAAYAGTLKRRLVADQTLEPTAIAGFNQFFDTFNGTASQRAGVGIDARLTNSLWAGAEATYDDMDAPDDDAGGGKDVDETRVRGYLNATLGENLSLAFEPSWSRLTSDIVMVEPELQTLELPLTMSYFGESGLFGSVRGTFVSQDGADAVKDFGDDFFVLDASLGYRFPDQRGLLTLEARNIFDADFGYEERQLLNDFAADPRYARERAILLRLSVRL